MELPCLVLLCSLRIWPTSSWWKDISLMLVWHNPSIKYLAGVPFKMHFVGSSTFIITAQQTPHNSFSQSLHSVRSFWVFFSYSKILSLLLSQRPVRKKVRDWRGAKSSNQLVIKANCDPQSTLKKKNFFHTLSKSSDKTLLWDFLKFTLWMKAFSVEA